MVQQSTVFHKDCVAFHDSFAKGSSVKFLEAFFPMRIVFSWMFDECHLVLKTTFLLLNELGRNTNLQSELPILNIQCF